VNSIDLLLAAALAICVLVAVRQAWELKSKAISGPARLRSWARIVACAGGVVIIIPMMGGFHGWALKIFITAGIIFLVGFGFLIYAARASSAGVERDSRP
jgi:cytochrome b561